MTMTEPNFNDFASQGIYSPDVDRHRRVSIQKRDVDREPEHQPELMPLINFICIRIINHFEITTIFTYNSF